MKFNFCFVTKQSPDKKRNFGIKEEHILAFYTSMENILKSAINLEKDEVGLETTKIWGSVTLSTGDLPLLYTPPSFDIFILLDASNTMQGDKLRGVKESIISILSNLNEKSTFSLVVYNITLELVISFIICTPENKVRIVEQLDKVVPLYLANHHIGLSKIFNLVAKSSKIPALFFFSSGMTDDLHQSMLIKKISSIRGCITNVIGVGTVQNSKLLYGISHHFRGIYHYAPTPLETFRLTTECMKTLFSTLATEIMITLECFSGCRVISWSSSFEIVEKRLSKIYDAHSIVCSANEMRTFIFGLSLKSMTDLEKVDLKTGTVPIIWFRHPLALIKLSYLDLATGKRETREKELSVLRVRFPGYFPLADHLKEYLARLEVIEILNKYIKTPNYNLLIQLPEDVKKVLLSSKGLHKTHSICAYASSLFFERFV